LTDLRKHRMLKHMKKKNQEKLRQLKQIAEELREKSDCPLKATAKNAVPGEGNPNADLFFIGEAPGRNEDEQGKPFVGAAGKVLCGLLESIHIKREDVFITSIEKFRPPNNREPKPTEIMACFPYLERQIHTIQPKIIVTLGRHALRRMLAWEKGEQIDPPAMDKLHGKLITGKSGRKYFPIHHPAAVLYNPKLRELLQKDFQKLNILLHKNIPKLSQLKLKK